MRTRTQLKNLERKRDSEHTQPNDKTRQSRRQKDGQRKKHRRNDTRKETFTDHDSVGVRPIAAERREFLGQRPQ